MLGIINWQLINLLLTAISNIFRSCWKDFSSFVWAFFFQCMTLSYSYFRVLQAGSELYSKGSIYNQLEDIEDQLTKEVTCIFRTSPYIYNKDPSSPPLQAKIVWLPQYIDSDCINRNTKPTQNHSPWKQIFKKCNLALQPDSKNLIWTMLKYVDIRAFILSNSLRLSATLKRMLNIENHPPIYVFLPSKVCWEEIGWISTDIHICTLPTIATFRF